MNINEDKLAYQYAREKKTYKEAIDKVTTNKIVRFLWPN